MPSIFADLKSYLADSLKIFALPVTTIQGASQRHVSIVSGLVCLLVLILLAGLLNVIISNVPGGLSQPLSLQSFIIDSAFNFLIFVLSYLILYALVVVFGGSTDLSKLLSAKLSLAAAVVGAFLLALFVKLIIGLLFLGASDGFGGGLIVLGENFGGAALSIILAVYMLIVARFGGQLSWLLAVVVGLIHLGIMVGLSTVYSLVILQDQFSAVGRIF